MDEERFKAALVEGITKIAQRAVDMMLIAIRRGMRTSNPYHVAKFRRTPKRREKS